MIATGTDHSCYNKTCGTGCIGLVDDNHVLYFTAAPTKIPDDPIEELRPLHWEDLSWMHDYYGKYKYIQAPQPIRRSMFSHSGFLPKRIRKKRKNE